MQILDLIETVAASLLGGGIASLAFRGLIKGWFSLQLERFKADQAAKLEPIKAELALLVRLQAGVHEKRSEVAAQVLISCLRYLDMLVYVTSPMHVSRSDDPSGPASFAQVIDERWKEAHSFQLDFSNSRALVDTYLPPEVAELMNQIWSLRADIWANQSTHFAMVGQGPDTGREFWKQGFGSLPESKALALKEQAKTILRPIVQQDAALSEVVKTAASGEPPNKALKTDGRSAPAA